MATERKSGTSRRIRLKCHYQSDIRVVRLNEDTSFGDLVSRLNDDYGFAVTLKYQDSDGDMIQLETQNDLDELLEETSTQSIKVFISEASQSNTPVRSNVNNSGGSSGSHRKLHKGLVSKVSVLSSADVKKKDIIDQAMTNLARRKSKTQLLQQSANKRQNMLQSKWRWQRGEILGQGAFGTVYLGLNLNSGELMAVKQLDSNEVTKKQIMSLEHEIAMMRNLDHENITRYLGTDRTEDTLSIFLEYVPGGSIHSLLERFGSFEETVTRTYTRQLLLGLEYLHRNGIAHRDIKGANILVANDGTVKLADFGASKSVGHKSLTATGIKGTPMWMAPEVIKQQQTVTGWKKADIWSVGCTVIEMVTGAPPWSKYSNPVTAMYHIACEDEIPDIPDILSDQGKAFLLMALKRNPDVRPDATSLLLNPFVAFVEQWCVRSKDVDYPDRPNTAGGLNDERDTRSRQRGRGASRREPRWIRETHSRQSSVAGGNGSQETSATGSLAPGSILTASVVNSPTKPLQQSYRPDVSIDFSKSIADSELAAFITPEALAKSGVVDFPFDAQLEMPSTGHAQSADWDERHDLGADASFESQSPMRQTSDASMEESMDFDDSYDMDEFANSSQASPTRIGSVPARGGGRGVDFEESHDSIDSALQSSADEVRLQVAGKMPHSHVRRASSGVSLSSVYRSRTAPVGDALESYRSLRSKVGAQAVMLPPESHVATARAGTTQPQKKRDPRLAQLHAHDSSRAQSSEGMYRPSKNVVGGRNFSNKSARNGARHPMEAIGARSAGDRQLSPVSLDFISKHKLTKDKFSNEMSSRTSSRTGSRQRPSQPAESADPHFGLMVGGSATGIRVNSRRANEIRKATFYDSR